MDAVAQSYYEVARTIVGFFDADEFTIRWDELYPTSKPSQSRLDCYSFNVRAQSGPAFLWADKRGSYVFVDINGAPKAWHARARVAAPRSSKSDISGLKIDIERARTVARLLDEAFLPTGPGIFGEHAQTQTILPMGLIPATREHLLFLTFTNCVNRARDALDLWRRCCDAWANPAYRYLFEPGEVQDAGFDKLRSDLVDLKISRKHQVDCRSWYQIAKTLHQRWTGDPRRFLEACNFHAPTILARLRSDLTDGEPAFPLLRGAKIAPLWIRMLCDDAGIVLSDLADVPIAVDVHVLRATLCSGVITGQYRGREGPLFEQVRRGWHTAVQDLARATGEPMVALDIDEALWTLSRSGCSRRGNGALGVCPSDCPLADGCAKGAIIIQNGICAFDLESAQSSDALQSIA